MSEITRVGADLAKRVIQVHAVDVSGKPVTNRALPPDKFITWCAQLPPGCLVAMEASSSAHHWARKLIALGLDARIIGAHLVAPYRLQGKSGKNDANDAAAICEAASRPQMHFVPVKSVEQQSMLCIHRLREGFKQERTACINRISGLLAEFGLVFAQKPAELRQALPDAIEDASNELGGLARLSLQRALAQWHALGVPRSGMLGRVKAEPLYGYTDGTTIRKAFRGTTGLRHHRSNKRSHFYCYETSMIAISPGSHKVRKTPTYRGVPGAVVAERFEPALRIGITSAPTRNVSRKSAHTAIIFRRCSMYSARS